MGGIRAATPEAHILVVDDNSPDGTGRLADRMAGEDALVHVLHRPGKGGLGRAYTAGFAHALEQDAGYVIEMDADLSHDPADLPRFIAAARRRRRPRARLALHDPAAGSRTGAWSGGSSPASGCGYAAPRARREGARPHRRLQVLPRRRAAGRSAPDAPSAQGYAFQVGAHPTASLLARPERGRGADPLPRAPARRVQDVRAHRRRGGAARSGPEVRARGDGVRWRRAAHLPMHWSMKADDLALVQGWPHTARRLSRWNAARGGSSPRGRSAAAGDPGMPSCC